MMEWEVEGNGVQRGHWSFLLELGTSGCYLVDQNFVLVEDQEEAFEKHVGLVEVENSQFG